MKVKHDGNVYEVIGNYTINKKQGYVLFRKLPGICTEEIVNVLSDLCVPVITVETMVPGRKYKFTHANTVYLCVNKGGSAGIDFSEAKPYVVDISTGTIYPMSISLNTELLEVK